MQACRFSFCPLFATQFRSLLWLLFFRFSTASPRGVYVPRQTTVLTFVHRYVIAFRCGATSGAIYCPMLLLSRTCKSCAEIYLRLFTFSFYSVISNANSFSFNCSMHVYELQSINDNQNTTMSFMMSSTQIFRN